MKLMAKLTLIMGVSCAAAFLAAPSIAHSTVSTKGDPGPSNHKKVAQTPGPTPAVPPSRQGPNPCH